MGQSVKKLIEVALPLEAINAESAREKSIRHGHPSTLHLWWSRKPAATARGVLWASLVDDPSSHPERFPTEEAQKAERQRLHTLLTELVKWENSNNEALLDKARAEIRKSMGDEPLIFLDPFAGGGSIPLEAQRLGLEAHAHDLNPVAVMINKAMIEIPPRFAGQAPVNPETRKQLGSDRSWRGASGLAEDVRWYGEWMKQEAFRRIGHLYPQVEVTEAMTAERPLLRNYKGRKLTVIAWKWARTVRCPNPACGCEMPLASSFVLSKKKGKEAWIEPIINGKTINYQIRQGKCPKDRETNKLGKGGSFRCPVCGATTEKQYIHDAFMSKTNGAVLMAIAAEGKSERIYLSPTPEQTKIAHSAVPEWEPEAEMNTKCTDLVSGRGYGITHWKQLFTPRQLTALTTFSDLVAKAQQQVTRDALIAGLPDDDIPLAEGGHGALAYGQAVAVYLAFAVDKSTNRNNALCPWQVSVQCPGHLYSRQAIPMTYDFAEANIFGPSGSFESMFQNVIAGLLSTTYTNIIGGVANQCNAKDNCNIKNIIISSDPPYYDNIGYADLSDFFYIWLRRSLKDTYPKLFQTMLVPKAEELVATPYRFGGSRERARNFFEEGMKAACRQLYASAREDVPVTIYYAYKQSESDEDGKAQASTGWETMLSAIVRAGFAITGTWPMRTERSSRSNALETNALASSIVLVCRKRPKDALTCSRRDFLAGLRRELRPALKSLQTSNIAPVDMAQAAIGPGMAVFSRHAAVLDASGAPLSVRSALQMINQELDAYLSEQEGNLDEATRFCLALYTQYAFNGIKFGEADVLARAKNTSVDKLAELGLVSAKKGLVHLKTREELPSPKKDNAHDKSQQDKETSLWLLTQQLTRAMQMGGNEACARIVCETAGSAADGAKALAYRLYILADQKGWTQEAYAYNSLVAAWPEIQAAARKLRNIEPEQGTLN